MIDWLTLRIPLTDSLGPDLYRRIQDATGRVVSYAPDGSKNWEKAFMDVDALRSDTPGLYWTVQGDGKQKYLAIGGSPASVEHGINVFGSSDIRHCAEVMVRFAGQCLSAILPSVDHWDCRRIDITENYDLGGHAEVKQALRILINTDTARRKANSDRHGGDSVYYSPKSDRLSGKAYHKGPQLRQLIRKAKLADDYQEAAALCDRLLRLELKLGSRWFRESKGLNWLTDITPEFLTREHSNFFNQFFGRLEVTDMSRLLLELEKVAPTPGQAKAAFDTWAKIRALGFESCRLGMPERTFYRHKKILLAAGLSEADLCASNVVPIRRSVLNIGQPVTSWADLRRAA